MPPIAPATRSIRLLLRSLLCLSLTAAFLQAQEKLTVLFSAEAHGSLLPCDCPLQPLGGVARRASLIESLRQDATLLIDGGGWSAGGLYDEETDGDPQRDLLRTELMARAMAAMRYDAILDAEQDRDWVLRPGNDADLQHLQNARTWQEHEQLQYKELVLNGTPILLIGLTQNVTVETFQSLRDSKATDKTRVIVVSRTGEAALEALLRKLSVPVALALNAGRKSTERVWWRINGTPVVNFDFQTQKLAVIELTFAVDKTPAFRVKQRPLDEQLPAQSRVQKLLEPHLEVLNRKGKQKIKIEFFTLPDCPHCAALEPLLEEIQLKLGNRVSVQLHFYVNRTTEGLTALHGPQELQEARVQAVVQRYYPERIWDWLRWRRLPGHRELPWERGAEALGLLKARLRGALQSGEGEQLLEQDYRLGLRRRVEGTPTLIVANKTYDDAPERLKLLRTLCGLLAPPQAPLCAEVPACFFDAQCRKRYFVGRCLEAGTPQARCDFSQPAIRTQVTILQDSKLIYDPHERILEILVGYLPGMSWTKLDLNSAEGRQLAQRLEVKRLPIFMLEPNAKEEYGYEKNLKPVVIEKSGLLFLRPETGGAHRLIERPRIEGQADLFVARFSRYGQQATDVALEFLKAGQRQYPGLRLHDAVFWVEQTDANGKNERQLAAAGGRAELDEAALALAIQTLAPGKFPDYLEARGKRRASLFWEEAVQAVGLQAQDVKELAHGRDGWPVERIVTRLQATADLLEAIDGRGEVILLGENCEVIPVRSRAQLRYYLERILDKP